MAKGPTRTMWRRTLIILAALLVVGFGAVIASLIRLQVFQSASLKKDAVEQQMSDVQLVAQRGTIYDANNKILAQSATVWKVILEPIYFEDKEDDTAKKKAEREELRQLVTTQLATILEVEPATITEKMGQGGYYQVIKNQIETEERDQILALKEQLVEEYNLSSGILLEEDFKRYYPYGTLASSVLGFVGKDGQGLAGLEAYYDDYLSGTAGRLISIRDGVGDDTPFAYDQMVDAEDGYSLKLTIDETIQHILEKYLDEGVANNNVHNRATAICMNVKTGGVLGLAVSGDFDPNDPYTITDQSVLQAIRSLPEKDRAQAESDALQAQWRNKAVNDTYYPGSVFKVMTLSMVLEENLVKESDTFTCTGFTQVADRTINCHVHEGHGTKDVTHGTINSCNPLFMWLGFKLGKTDFLNYFDAFGFTEKTGIDLPGESRSIYHARDTMGEVDLAVYSFGQNFSITPIQMVTAMSAVANGGYLLQPYVVQQVMDSKGNIVQTTETNVKRQVISTETANRVKQIMYQNAVEGTAKNGYVAGYGICGKTGTSEKVDKYNQEGGAAKDAQMEYIASYCGFAPVQDPEIALLVFFDEPDNQGNYYGGSVAGPVFANMMSEILPYLGVTPQYTEEEAAQLDQAVPNVIGETVDSALSKVEEEGLSATYYGYGDTVVAQSPEPGVAVPAGGSVVLFTDEDSQKMSVEVPNFSGLGFYEARDAATMAGVQMRVTGAASSGGGVASSQSIAAGKSVKPGTIVTVNFITRDTVQ